MGAFAAGSVVLVTFPFSDLSQTKLRPAVVLANADRGDWVLCQITSNPYTDLLAVELTDEDFRIGRLDTISYARPGKLFTLSTTLVVSEVGKLNKDAFELVVRGVVSLLEQSIALL